MPSLHLRTAGPCSRAVPALAAVFALAAGPLRADTWNTGATGVIFPSSSSSKFAVGTPTATPNPGESFKAEIRSADSRVLRLATSSTTSPNVTLHGDPNAPSAFFVLNAWDGGFLFSTGALNATGVGTERMRISGSTGAVTVAGGLSAASLTTSGDITTNGKLNVKTWSMEVPDYVFDEKRHQPMKLRDVEKFVRKHRHLPEVPSARELKAQGMDLAEMNLRLLKKVEELTLYAIEQEKRLEAQDRKIQALSDRMR